MKLEIDFRKFIENLEQQKLIIKDSVPYYNSLFSDKWPQFSQKVIEYCRKSRLKEVKDFFQAKQSLIVEGSMWVALARIQLFDIFFIKYF